MIDQAPGLCQFLPVAVILRQVSELASHIRLLQGPQPLGQLSQSLFMGLGEASVGVQQESPGPEPSTFAHWPLDAHLVQAWLPSSTSFTAAWSRPPPHLTVLAGWKLREAPLHHVLHPEGVHPQQVEDHGVREAELGLQLGRLPLGQAKEASEARGDLLLSCSTPSSSSPSSATTGP